MLQRADELRKQQRTVGAEHRALRKRAIDDELAERPAWIDSALGPERLDPHLEERRQRAAREIAGYRIDHRISDLQSPFGGRIPDGSTQRTLSEIRERAALQPGNSESTLEMER